MSEIQKEIVIEKTKKFLLKYWQFIIFIMLLCITSSILYMWFQYNKKKEIYDDAGVFIEIITQLQSGKTRFESVISRLENLSLKHSSYAVMAKLYLAWFYDEKNEVDKAILLYDSISNNKNIDICFRDFSKILSINLKIRSNKIESKEAINELTQYIKTNPIYTFSAQIIQASLLIKENMHDRAGEVLDKLLTNTNVGYHTRQTAMFLATNIYAE